MTPHPSQEPVTVDVPTNRSVRMEQAQSVLDSYLNQTSDEKLPSTLRVTKQPVHLMICYMLAAGRTRKEIAEATGYGQPAITELTRQPWFKTKLKEICETSGKDMVKSFLEGEGIPALEVLRTIAHDPAQRGATRVTAANSILDRWLGKPIAYVEAKNTLNIHTAGDAADHVKAELERVNSELSRLGVNPSNVPGTN